MTAFSNGFEWDAWSANWCDRCTKDEVLPGCRLLDVALVEERIPAEWSPGNDDLGDRYHCSEFQEGK